MGKKRIIKKSGRGLDQGRKERALSKIAKKRIEKGVLHIEATFNNTKVVLTDEKGNAIMASSAGSLGFSGARKSTPYAAAKVGEVVAPVRIRNPDPPFARCESSAARSAPMASSHDAGAPRRVSSRERSGS